MFVGIGDLVVKWRGNDGVCFVGAPFVITGMTWARAAIFYGSDFGKSKLASHNVHPVLAVALPPLVLSTAVQCINMPLVRA